jgi:predicted nucleic acid-binding protein
VEGELILETTFLVDLERELRRERSGPASRFLERHSDHRLYLTFTVVGELACGVSLSDRERWEAFIRPFTVLGFSTDVAWHYGEAYRYLRQNGLLIGTNDLWIAATALSNDLPVVTRNTKHYQRVPHLRVLSYGP